MKITLKKMALSTLALGSLVVGSFGISISENEPKVVAYSSYDEVLHFPTERYPLTADHISDAIAAGHPSVCTIDRDGADANRRESLAGIPTKSGYDRDEWPMAVCEEGGAGASVRYVPSSDNRGSGAWVGNAIEDFSDGTRVKFILN